MQNKRQMDVQNPTLFYFSPAKKALQIVNKTWNWKCSATKTLQSVELTDCSQANNIKINYENVVKRSAVIIWKVVIEFEKKKIDPLTTINHNANDRHEFAKLTTEEEATKSCLARENRECRKLFVAEAAGQMWDT